jgi:uncharacterized protein (DUF2062 family)
MRIVGALLSGMGFGWLVGFTHRGWLDEQNERRKSRKSEREHRDHLNLGGPHYRL